jgi:enoyl-CoA hydratase/carnithine racemase
MTPEVLRGFADAVAKVRADRDVRCVVVTGSGASFCAGADFKSGLQTDAKALPHERSFAMYEPFLSLLELPVPVIGALNGHAIGGGFGLSLVCDVRLCAEGAKYGANFTKLGLSSGMAISYVLPRLVGVSVAAELLFTGRLFDGEEAVRIGYASRTMASADVLPAAHALATIIADNAPLAVKLTKKLLYQGLAWDPRAHALAEAYAQAETVASDDAKEGVAALLEKRQPIFSGR